jgi:hypothetical protein
MSEKSDAGIVAFIPEYENQVLVEALERVTQSLAAALSRAHHLHQAGVFEERYEKSTIRRDFEEELNHGFKYFEYYDRRMQNRQSEIERDDQAQADFWSRYSDNVASARGWDLERLRDRHRKAAEYAAVSPDDGFDGPGPEQEHGDSVSADVPLPPKSTVEDIQSRRHPPTVTDFQRQISSAFGHKYAGKDFAQRTQILELRNVALEGGQKLFAIYAQRKEQDFIRRAPERERLGKATDSLVRGLGEDAQRLIFKHIEDLTKVEWQALEFLKTVEPILAGRSKLSKVSLQLQLLGDACTLVRSAIPAINKANCKSEPPAMESDLDEDIPF